MQLLTAGANMGDKWPYTIIAMNTEKATNSNNSSPTPEQREGDLNTAKQPSLQFGLSIAVGVLTIIIAAASFYFGIIH